MPSTRITGSPKGPRTALTAGTGVVLVGAASALVAAAGFLQPAGSAEALPAVPAAVPAGQFVGICPEPARLLQGAVAGADPQFSPVSQTARTLSSAVVLSNAGGTLPGSALAVLGQDGPQRVLAEGSPQAAQETAPAVSNDQGLTGVTAAVARGEAITAPTKLTADPLGQQQASANAVMAYTADDGDLRGLAGADCQAPGNDLWLTGASTTVGSTSVLKLSNPSQSPATVDLELFTGQGPLQAAGSRGLLVAPGETKSVVLGGLAPNQQSLSVRVRSSGAPVAAVIQQSVLRGLTPGGVEYLQPVAPAGTTQVIPGVLTEDPDQNRQVSRQEGYAAASPALQVTVPGSSDAVLDVRVYGTEGPVDLPGGGVVTAAAGSVTEIPLDTLPRGSYTIAVSSDVSVIAAARMNRGVTAGQPVDFGVAGAGSRLGNQHVASVPVDVESTLVFGAPSGNAAVRLTPVGTNGSIGTEQVLAVSGGTSVAINPRAMAGGDLAAVIISASGDPVYGSQLLTLPNKAAVSSVPLAPGRAGQQNVPVNLGY